MSLELSHDDIERQLCLDSLFYFTKYGLGYKDLTKQTHLPIAEALQAPTARKMICVPRGTFKSSLASVAYPMWRLLHDPNDSIMIDSELYANSKNFLSEIKAHYQHNERFKSLFGDYVGNKWNESGIVISKRTDPTIKEPSVFASGIEANKTSTHPKCIIADDLSSYTNCRNPEVAKKTIEHYGLYTSLLPPGGTVVIIGTRYSEIDIIGYIIENELGIKDGNVHELKKIYCPDR